MRVLTDQHLAAHTTLGVGGPVPALHDIDREQDLLAAVQTADDHGEPFCLLAGGSNIVVADQGIPFAAYRPLLRGIDQVDAGDEVQLRVAAGEPWDDVVRTAVELRLGGIECLAGIPGLAGAAPIQNIGAYGQDIAQTLLSVRVYDRHDRRVVELPADRCRLRYRDSAFKTGRDRLRYLILSLTLRLRRGPPAAPTYAELRHLLGSHGAAAPSVEQIREAVLALRRSKGMVYDPNDPDSRSAGSFFLNPIVPTEQADQIERAEERAHAMPRFAAGSGQTKLSAAWLVEHSGFRRGQRCGGAAVSSKHTLALVNREHATAADIVVLAQQIQHKVRRRFGVALAPEPVFLGFDSDPGGLSGRLPSLGEPDQLGRP